MSAGAEEARAIGPHGARVTGGHERSSGCWETNWGSPEEQQELLITESSLQPDMYTLVQKRSSGLEEALRPSNPPFSSIRKRLSTEFLPSSTVLWSLPRSEVECRVQG